MTKAAYMTITWKEVDERMDRAAAVMRRLPAASRPRLAQLQVQILRPGRERFANAVDAGGWEREEPEKIMRHTPTSAAEITDMEEAMRWLLMLEDVRDRRMVWWRAEGRRWGPIYKEMGLSRRQAWVRWSNALITIAHGLSKSARAAAAARARTRTGRGTAKEPVGGAKLELVGVRRG